MCLYGREKLLMCLKFAGLSLIKFALGPQEILGNEGIKTQTQFPEM